MTWPWLVNTATASGSTMHRVNLRMFWSGHLKTIWPLALSGAAMNSRRASLRIPTGSSPHPRCDLGWDQAAFHPDHTSAHRFALPRVMNRESPSLGVRGWQPARPAGGGQALGGVPDERAAAG